jgi:hypothetical protein
MAGILMTFYQVVGLLGAKGGSWGAEMQSEISPNVGKLPEGNISTY